ncbi:MAG: type II toxin-antitoxin system RelB/DinJ family antitoxin [Eubacteriales bacterium]|nr:type II toxin-antitoxin system RelB/DinJ family antitoxin [Eubacteriales bacterium]
MTTTNVSIRMDSELKKQSEKLFADMGLNMTTAFTIFVKAVVREGRIPFEIKADPFYSRRNVERLNRAAKDMDKGVRVAEHEVQEAAE